MPSNLAPVTLLRVQRRLGHRRRRHRLQHGVRVLRQRRSLLVSVDPSGNTFFCVFASKARIIIFASTIFLTPVPRYSKMISRWIQTRVSTVE